MNRKLNPVVMVGALLALVGVAVLAVLAARGGGTSSSSTKVKALVTTAAVAPGTPAAAAGLTVTELPSSSVPPGAFSDPAAVTGQVALRSLAKGEVVVPGAFGQQGVAAAGGV